MFFIPYRYEFFIIFCAECKVDVFIPRRYEFFDVLSARESAEVEWVIQEEQMFLLMP